MSHFDKMSPIDFGGSHGYLNTIHLSGLASKHPGRITKAVSAGHSPRKTLRRDTMYPSGAYRRTSTRSDEFVASFYAALQKATASQHSSTRPTPTCQSHRPFQTYLDRKELPTDNQAPATCKSFVDWEVNGTLMSPCQRQYKTYSTGPSFPSYSPPQRTLSHEKPDFDWPTYIPIISSDSALPSPQPRISRNYNAFASTNTTAVSSPELFSDPQFPEPKTPPSYASDISAPDEVLVGVGLYDEPDSVSWEESSTTGRFRFGTLDRPLYQSERTTGKGLKLEETFSPPPIDSDSDGGV
ncbi:hypothetical protein PRK78_006524 [Emydomyces testavorans]|uniref:Uncharacterized protein n=1 Tax=Emydomyces testavorans TaxID=2070801 RepID=A0AAF0DLJ6_9EURO|nr:hypothetical protein PRK78_006524 [Emydomyces testavorans]